MDQSHIKSILDVRLALELPAIETVANNRSEAILSQFKTIVDSLKLLENSNHQPINYASFAALQYQFHHYICFTSGNTITPLIFNAFKIPTLVMWEDATRKIGVPKTIKKIEILYNHIRDKDGEKAQLQLTAIIQEYINLL